MDKQGLWIFAVIFLSSAIIAGGIIIGLNYHRTPGVQISLAPEVPLQGVVYIGGEANTPGFYPWRAGDSLEEIISAAGGLKEGMPGDNLTLMVGDADLSGPQKVNINRAEAWLLEALPGIGRERAEAIVAYRREHGLFRDIDELKKIPGLGPSIFENIKDLVTIVD